MARGSSKGLHRIKMIQHILDNHINGPFTVADLIERSILNQRSFLCKHKIKEQAQDKKNANYKGVRKYDKEICP